MSKFVDRLAGALGFSTGSDDDYDDNYEEEESYDEYDEDDYEDEDTYQPQPARTSSRSSYTRSGGSSYQDSRYQTPRYRTTGYSTSSVNRSGNNKVVNLHASVQMEVVVANPQSLDEARVIAMSIKEKKPVIINLEFVEHSIAQRITDFLCGCCCAVDGNIQRISDKIFMIAPENMDFAGDVDLGNTLANEGLAFPWGDKK